MSEKIISLIDNKIQTLRSQIDTLMSKDPKINNYIVELSQVNILRELKTDINALNYV